MSAAVRVVTLTADELEALLERAARRGAELAAVTREEPAEWLPTREAAAVLRMHAKTLERLARAGEIPAARVGRLLRFRRADLEAFIAGTR